MPTTRTHANAPQPRPSAVTFMTTEHFTLQGARSSTIAESIGRATMFLGSLSGGLVALGLLATATQIGTAFYAFALIVLPTSAFLGLVTFERVLQSGIEDHGYARRIAQLRSSYFDTAPELTPYLARVAPRERLRIEGLAGGFWQKFRTVAGMIAVITAVVAGSTVALAATLASRNVLAAGLAGGTTSLGVFIALMRQQAAAWEAANNVALSTWSRGSSATEPPQRVRGLSHDRVRRRGRVLGEVVELAVLDAFDEGADFGGCEEHGPRMGVVAVAQGNDVALQRGHLDAGPVAAAVAALAPPGAGEVAGVHEGASRLNR